MTNAQTGDTVNPQVQLVSPKEGQHLRGKVEIEVNASDDVGVTEVSAVRNGGFLDSTSKTPYRIPWDTTLEADGPHTLVVKAQDAAGNLTASGPVSVIVDNTLPSVELRGLKDEVMVTGKVELQAEAKDNIGIKEVRYSIDDNVKGVATEPPYSWIWDPTVLSNGPRTVEVTAVDKAGNKKSSKPILIRVANPNRPPVMLPPDPKTIKEGDALTFGATAYDPDGVRDTLTYKAIGLPPWGRIDEKGVLTLQPTPDVATQKEPEKEFKIRLQVCDPEPLCASQDLTVKVINVNQAPQLPPISNLEVHEGEPVRFTIQPAKDPDNEPITYEAKPLPPWLKFDPVTQTFEGKPGYDLTTLQDPIAVYRDIRVEACDPEPKCAQQKFTLTLNNTNRPPVLESIEEQTIDEGKTLTLELHASDPDDDDLILTADSALGNAVFVDHGYGKGTLGWPIRLDQANHYQLIFSAKEAKGNLKDTKRVDIVVREKSLSISGTITETRGGGPFTGATVQALLGSEIIKEVKTDAKGFYIISDLSPGNYIIRPYFQYERKFDATTPAEQVGIHFSPLSTSVKIQDKDQQKVNFSAGEVD